MVIQEIFTTLIGESSVSSISLGLQNVHSALPTFSIFVGQYNCTYVFTGIFQSEAGRGKKERYLVPLEVSCSECEQNLLTICFNPFMWCVSFTFAHINQLDQYFAKVQAWPWHYGNPFQGQKFFKFRQVLTSLAVIKFTFLKLLRSILWRQYLPQTNIEVGRQQVIGWSVS